MDPQLSVVHQGAGQARQVQVRGQVNPLDEARLRAGRGAEGGGGGGGGAGLALLGPGLLHGHHRQAPPLQFDGDVARGVTAGVQGYQEVAVAVVRDRLDGLLHLHAGGFSQLLFTITQPEIRMEIRISILCFWPSRIT